MLGTSLPFHWLLAGGAPLGDVPTVLNTLKAHGVESVELRTVNPNTNPDDVLYAANLLWDAGFVITVHAAPKSVERAVDDVFIPLTALLDHLRQEKLTVVVHPDFDDNAALLTTLADHRDAHGCPIVFALENNRLLPGKVDGDCAALVPMTSMHSALMEKKRFYDMTGNNINHPCDFLARVYAQVILAQFA